MKVDLPDELVDAVAQWMRSNECITLHGHDMTDDSYTAHIEDLGVLSECIIEDIADCIGLSFEKEVKH